MPRSIRALLALLLSVMAAPALAHHGWSWTQDGYFRLEGVVRSVYVGNPHATIEVEADGEIWQVELAPPAATLRAGFTEQTARIGGPIVAIGNRSQDEAELRMKAVRVIVDGSTYDVYPGRAPPA